MECAPEHEAVLLVFLEWRSLLSLVHRDQPPQFDGVLK